MQDLTAGACIIALDLETTGLSASRDRVVEFAAVRWQHGVEVGHFQTLVHPGRPIPPAAIRVHGITNDMVREAPTAAEVLPAFLAFCEGDLVVAHNANFDLGFIRAEAARIGMTFDPPAVVDTCRLARTCLPGCPNYRLETLKRALGLGVHQAHRALDDARDCLQIFLQCRRAETPELRLPIKPDHPLPANLASLQGALEQGGTLHIEYVDTRGRATCREIRPLMVTRNGSVMVLEAHCLLRNELRHFALDRIRRAWHG